VVRENSLNRWGDIVDTLKLDLGKPINYVTTEEVREISRKDPRLMASIDREDRLPLIFQKAGVFVLPISRTRYAIVKGKGYHRCDEIPSRVISFPSQLPFLPAAMRIGISESQRIDYAASSGMIGKIFGTKRMLPGFRLRKHTPEFSFKVGDSPVITVKSVQIEFDACYDDGERMIHFEGKVGHKAPDTFFVKQLYFPFRFMKESLPDRKPVEMFFFYNQTEGTYSCWRYEFPDPLNYEDISLAGSWTFRILPPIAPLDIEEIMGARSKRAEIPNQADDIEKIMALPFYVSEGFDNYIDLAERFGFEPRQAHYYGLAAESLGFVRLESGRFVLTELGEDFLGLDTGGQKSRMCESILTVPLIKEIISRLDRQSEAVTFEEIQEMVQRSLDRHSRRRRKQGRSISMGKRRAQTVIAWFRWLEKTTREFKVDRDKSITRIRD